MNTNYNIYITQTEERPERREAGLGNTNNKHDRCIPLMKIAVRATETDRYNVPVVGSPSYYKGWLGGRVIGKC